MFVNVARRQQQVEFELPDTGETQRLSKNSEVLVPAGATYALRHPHPLAGGGRRGGSGDLLGVLLENIGGSFCSGEGQSPSQFGVASACEGT